MKKLSLVALAGAMAFLLSSCFALQSFSVLAGALKPRAVDEGGVRRSAVLAARRLPPSLMLATNSC